MTRPRPGRFERFMRIRQLRRLERDLDRIARVYEEHTGGADDVRRLQAATQAMIDSDFDQDDLNALSHRYTLQGVHGRDERQHPRWRHDVSTLIRRGRDHAVELRVVRWWTRSGTRPTV